jgi:hypothetical protein
VTFQMREDEIEIQSLIGRTIVSAELIRDDGELVVVLDDTRTVTVIACAHDDAWLTIYE